MDCAGTAENKEYYEKDALIRRVCPVCESDVFAELYKERGNIGIVKCAKCGLIYVNPFVKNPEKVYWGDEG